MSLQLSKFCKTNPIRPFRAMTLERAVRAFSEKQNRQIKANFLNGISSRRLWESQFKANPKPNSWAAIAPFSLSTGAGPERDLRRCSVLVHVALAEVTG